MTRLRYRLELLYPFDRLRAGSVEALGLVSLTALGSLALYRSIPFYAAAYTWRTAR